jgi:hypothetical protein
LIYLNQLDGCLRHHSPVVEDDIAYLLVCLANKGPTKNGFAIDFLVGGVLFA